MQTSNSTNTQELNSVIHQMKIGIGDYNNGTAEANSSRIEAVRQAILHLETLLKDSNNDLS